MKDQTAMIAVMFLALGILGTVMYYDLRKRA